MERPIRHFVAAAAALGVVTGLAIFLGGTTPATSYIGDVLDLALLATAFFAGRQARREGRRPGWLGGLVGAVGGFLSGLGYLGVTLPVSRFHTVTTPAGLRETAAQQAAVANGVGAHVGAIIGVTLVLGLFGILAGTVGGATGQPPGSTRAV